MGRLIPFTLLTRTYDWFNGYDYFKEALLSLLQLEDEILMLGCGNSSKKFKKIKTWFSCSPLAVSERLYQDGFERIVNVDYSAAVIEQMSRRCAQSCPKMCWITADFRNMEVLNDDSFSVVLDKGSLDALWSDGGSQWSPSEAVLTDINATLREALRVLKRPGGRFISITFGQPHFRLPFMQREGWQLANQQTLGLYYIYTFVTV